MKYDGIIKFRLLVTWLEDESAEDAFEFADTSFTKKLIKAPELSVKGLCAVQQDRILSFHIGIIERVDVLLVVNKEQMRGEDTHRLRRKGQLMLVEGNKRLILNGKKIIKIEITYIGITDNVTLSRSRIDGADRSYQQQSEDA